MEDTGILIEEVSIDQFKKLMVILGKPASILVKNIKSNGNLEVHILYKKEYEGMVQQHLKDIKNDNAS